MLRSEYAMRGYTIQAFRALAGSSALTITSADRQTDTASRSDPYLRSTREVIGYRLQASDGPLGHVVDFIVDDTTWTIRSVVVDTGTWWAGKRVILPWQRIERIPWADMTVEVGVLRATIKQYPRYERAGLRQQKDAGNRQMRP